LSCAAYSSIADNEGFAWRRDLRRLLWLGHRHA
jgi:hypothetical protein